MWYVKTTFNSVLFEFKNKYLKYQNEKNYIFTFKKHYLL